MSGDWDIPDYGYLKGLRPTERQLRHLKEDLLYDGPEITDAYEASQLIDILRSDPTIHAKREYAQRMEEGPTWIAWEKWMTHISRKEHDKRNWLDWWTATIRLASDAGIEPPQEPPLPDSFQGGTYHTPEGLLAELREVFGLPKHSPIRLEISVATKEEALLAKEEIKRFRERLRVIDDDCQWMLARLRSGDLSNLELSDLLRENGGGELDPNPSGETMREVRKYFANNYGAIRSMIRSLKAQMADFFSALKKSYRV